MASNVTFRAKTVSAMFLHGADNRAAEPRSAPFKSAARYWFRAVLGAAVPWKCAGDEAAAAGRCNCLRCWEGRVFGSTAAGTGVAFHLSVPEDALRIANRFLLPHHDQRARGRDGPSPSKAVMAGADLAILLSPSRPTLPPERLAAAAAALWLAVHLGGFGQRSRRGAGSLRLVELKPMVAGLPAPIECGSVQDLAQYLDDGIAAARKAILSLANGAGARGAGKAPGFPQILPGSDDTRAQVVPLRAKEEQEARAEVMRGLRPFKNAVFGLPYMRRAQGDREVRGRHASPLWIHLHPLAGGKLAAVQTALRSCTLPREGKWEKVVEYLNSSAGRVPVTFC